MKRALIKSLASTAVVLAIILGCNTVIDVVDNGGGGGGTGGGFATVGSGFSDAPASPGGTGGTDGGGGGGTDNGGVELPSEETRSFFTAFQIDPVEEDSAGPKFVVAGDVDQDGLTDLVSAWNQSQPIQLHLQRRDPAGNISFRSITLAGTTPIAVVAGLELGFINDDAFPDVVVLVKASGLATFCPASQKDGDPSDLGSLDGQIIVLFNPGNPGLIADGDEWTEMALVNPFVSNRNSTGHEHFPGNPFKGIEESRTKPEWSGFTALAVADIDGLPGDEIVVALNPAPCETFNQTPPINTVDIWVNPRSHGDPADDPASWGVDTGMPFNLPGGAPITVMTDAPQVKDIALYDIDGDGDLDIVATYTNALSLNVRWARNPLVPHNAGGPGGAAEVASGFVPGIDVCEGGSNSGGDCDSHDDCPDITCTNGVCSNGGFGCTTDTDCATKPIGTCVFGRWYFFADGWQIRPIGQIDTAADILSLGDVDSDGFTDVAVRSTNGGIIQWFRRPNFQSLPPEFPPNDPVPDRTDFPWTVYTLTEFTDQEPQAIALGDVTGDGQVELLAAVGGGVFWFDATQGTSVYDPWVSNTIIQENPQSGSGGGATDGTTTTPGGTGVGVTQVDTSTYINALLIVDLDADGKNDVVGTLDRRSGSGLSDDRLVWYRNTRTDEP